MQNGIESINYEQIMNTPEIDNARKEGYTEGFEHGYLQALEDVVKIISDMEKDAFLFKDIACASFCLEVKGAIYRIAEKH